MRLGLSQQVTIIMTEGYAAWSAKVIFEKPTHTHLLCFMHGVFYAYVTVDHNTLDSIVLSLSIIYAV